MLDATTPNEAHEEDGERLTDAEEKLFDESHAMSSRMLKELLHLLLGPDEQTEEEWEAERHARFSACMSALTVLTASVLACAETDLAMFVANVSPVLEDQRRHLIETRAKEAAEKAAAERV